MFIINPYVRFALIAVGIIGGIALWAAFGFWYGFFFLLTGIILLIGYIILGPIAPAGKALQTGDFDKADRLLDLTINPKWLYVSNRAYYYLLKGSIALSRKDLSRGEELLKIAESIDLPSDNERGMIQIQLGHIAASKERWNQAQNHLRKAQGLKITQQEFKDQLKQLEMAIAQRGQVKAAMRMGRQGMQMMQPGGKRRRPKLR